jgi:hypothetical protein
MNSSARASHLTTFLVTQCDNNAIANTANELKCILTLIADFVNVMRKATGIRPQLVYVLRELNPELASKLAGPSDHRH